MGKLVYFKWMVEDAKVLKENLTTEQIGELFVAVMDYLQTGTVVEVSKEIRFPYADYRNKVDRASASYEETCAKRAESGKKGGTAKAKNASKTENKNSSTVEEPAPKTRFTPPTLKQFKNAINRLMDNNYREHADDYDMESFYDHLRENGWQYEGMSIQSREDWEAIAEGRFCDVSCALVSNYSAFQYLVATYPRLHHLWGDIDDFIDSLFESWDSHQRLWIINGQTFQQGCWRAALDALVADRIEELPP